MRLPFLLLLTALPSAAQELVFLTSPGSVDLGVTSPALVVESRMGGLPFANPTPITVTFTAPDGGFFEALELAPNGVTARWLPTRTIAITDGGTRTAPLFVRADVPGPLLVTASAPGFTTATVQFDISHFVLSENFEKTLRLTDSPPGPINTEFNTPAGEVTTCEISALSPLAGAGVLLLDHSVAADFQAARVQAVQPIRGTLHFRAWHREDPGPNGAWTVFELEGFNDVNPLILNNAKELLAFSLNGAQLTAQVGKASSAGDVRQTETRPDAGSWHLYEGVLEGMGTSDASVRWALDGTQRPAFQNLEWSGVDRAFIGLAMGGVFRRAASTPSQMRTDDVAISIQPLASRAVLTQRGVVNDCIALNAALSSTFDAGAVAPVPLTLDVQSTPTVTFFTDQTCTTPGPSQLSFARGGSDLNFSVRVSRNDTDWSFSATSPTLLNGPALAVHIDWPDAGTDAGMELDAGVDAGVEVVDPGTPTTGAYAVGCSCSSASGFVLGLSLLLALRRPRT